MSLIAEKGEKVSNSCFAMVKARSTTSLILQLLGETKTWYLLFAHLLNFPEIPHIFWPSSFNLSLSYALQRSSMARYFWYEYQDSTGSIHFEYLLGGKYGYTATAW